MNRLALATLDDMLDACLLVWRDEVASWNEQGMEFNGWAAGFYMQLSLRQALNIAKNNPFNFGDGERGPLLGKAKALVNVEAAISSPPA